MNAAAEHYRNKLAFETDAWDLNEMLREGHECGRHRRSIGGSLFAQEHIPGAINLSASQR